MGENRDFPKDGKGHAPDCPGLMTVRQAAACPFYFIAIPRQNRPIRKKTMNWAG